MANVTQGEINRIREIKRKDHDINLFILLHQLSTLMTNAVDIEIRHLRITQPQVSVLTMLSRQERPVTLDELANWCLKEFSSIFTLINRMEKKGLVTKTKNIEDAKTYVAMSKKGSIMYHQLVTEKSIHLIFNKLTEDEKTQLETLMKKLRDNARDLLGLDFRPPFLP
jgi:DNA-binding MarR family transcriptional regulator